MTGKGKIDGIFFSKTIRSLEKRKEQEEENKLYNYGFIDLEESFERVPPPVR